VNAATRQGIIGVGLSLAILASWIGLHLWGVLVHHWGPLDWLRTPVLVAVQSWLGTGLFIAAHDAIHGSLAPGRPRLNVALGQLCVGLYAGFAFDKLAPSHRQHHQAPGTALDPDFDALHPRGFARWFLAFFRRYFGWPEFLRVTAVLVIYLLLGARPSNLAVFWGLPALLSALQLFVFGTYLPHRHDGEEVQSFADAHRARTLDYPWLLSLLACFHFGRHHEHHLQPHVPWWGLPGVARRSPSETRPQVRTWRQRAQPLEAAPDRHQRSSEQ
jgi:beta-carotene ketolase (CrtW type)